jgi:hypothetical protein
MQLLKGCKMKIYPKNWKKFQHYKDRNPPWIKLHKDILDDYDWWSLPVASRALAPCLWLLASCHDDGIFDASYNVLAFRFRMKESDVKVALIPLIDKGYFVVDSGMLASCHQVVIPETETETETETYLCAFNEFWSAYPKKTGKDAALKAWKVKKPRIDDVMFALSWQRNSEQWQKNGGQFIPNPATYINQGRWQDEPVQESQEAPF